MIDINKKYTTRDGHDVVIYAVYPEQEYGVHGAILDGAVWSGHTWQNDGTFYIAECGKDDLIEVQEPPKELIRWVNIYSDKSTGTHRNFIDAKRHQGDTIARKRITIQYREGEFDE